MAIGVRSYLENLGHTVGYDKKTGDVLVKNSDGKMTSIGSDNFTLNDDGRYYAENEGDILSALSKSGISAKPGYSPVRNTMAGNNAVGYNEKTGQVYINGRDYNVDGKNLVKIGDKIYGEDSFLESVSKKPYKNEYADLEKETLNELLEREYEGYNPEKDKSYQAAYDSFFQNAKSDMGERGLISDSLSTYYASQGAEKLMPVFAEMDFEKYKYDTETLKDALGIMGDLDENSQSSYKLNSDNAHKENELMFGREFDVQSLLEKEKERESEEKMLEKEHENNMELTDKKHQNNIEILDKEQAFEKEQSMTEFEYEKEIKRLENDLGMTRDEAKLYAKWIYGV